MEGEGILATRATDPDSQTVIVYLRTGAPDSWTIASIRNPLGQLERPSATEMADLVVAMRRAQNEHRTDAANAARISIDHAIQEQQQIRTNSPVSLLMDPESIRTNRTNRVAYETMRALQIQLSRVNGLDENVLLD